MQRLEIIASNGEAMSLVVEQLIAIDGEPIVASQPSDAGLERRVSILEQLVLSLLGDKSFPLQSPKVSCSVELPPPSSPEPQEFPAIQLPVPSSELQSSSDESLA